MSAKILQLSDRDIGDIPRALRKLADQVENGEFGGQHNLAWVIDTGGGAVEIGLAGKCPEAGITAHFLFALAMRKLELT